MQPLIVANWKMNGTISDCLKLITELRHKLPQTASAVEIAVAPPFTALFSAHIALQETPLMLAAQNMHWESEGAYTGEVSGLFLKDAGCQMVILGHSERRQYFGETDETVNLKVRAALSNELTPIVCVGETREERKEGKTWGILEGQIKKGLQGLPMNDLKGMAIAYEPVWAIGTGQTATADEIGEAHRFLRGVLERSYDAPTANAIRLLYGGSVTADNAPSIGQIKNVDGVLVGGASLNAGKFLKIIGAFCRS